MNEIKFTIPGKPFGKQRPRVTKVGNYSKTYTPTETVAYENLVKLYYTEVAKRRTISGRCYVACKYKSIL